jgi:hypothetical protein
MSGQENTMTEPFEQAGQQAAAFQKMCLETFSKAIQTAFKFTPDSAPPEMLGQIRAAIFKTLAESWDEFMRSPQFLEGMRQWMENAITFRKTTNEFLGRVRNDLQAPSRNDIDTVMLTVRHLEQRLLDRLDEIAAQLKEKGPTRQDVRRVKQPVPGRRKHRKPGSRKIEARRAKGRA